MTTLLPADPMLDVLTDAIASKRDTMAMMEAALKQAREDLAHLRQRRAELLAKAAGFEVGQVWIADSHERRNQPCIVTSIESGYDETELLDWRIEVTFEADRYNGTSTYRLAPGMVSRLVGRVESGPLVDRLERLLRKPETAVQAA